MVRSWFRLLVVVLLAMPLGSGAGYLITAFVPPPMSLFLGALAGLLIGVTAATLTKPFWRVEGN